MEQDEVTYQFDSPEHFTAYIRAISAPIRAMIDHYAGESAARGLGRSRSGRSGCSGWLRNR